MFILGVKKMKGKRKRKSFLRGPKQGHDKKRSEGVARDIEVLRIQILFAQCPMPLPIEFVVVLVCFFYYYLVIFDVLST